jgi:hypothetical protein
MCKSSQAKNLMKHVTGLVLTLYIPQDLAQDFAEDLQRILAHINGPIPEWPRLGAINRTLVAVLAIPKTFV